MLWLATRAGKMALSSPFGITRYVLCRPSLFFVSLWISTPSRSTITHKKRSWLHAWSMTSGEYNRPETSLSDPLVSLLFIEQKLLMFVHFPSTPTPTPSNNDSIGFEYATSSSFKELRYVTLLGLDYVLYCTTAPASSTVLKWRVEVSFEYPFFRQLSNRCFIHSFTYSTWCNEEHIR